MTMVTAAYLAAVAVFCVGLYGIMTNRNLIRIAISVSFIESAALLALVASGYEAYGGRSGAGTEMAYADPVPHALALTGIVIGVSTTALALSLIIKLYKNYHTLDVADIKDARRRWLNEEPDEPSGVAVPEAYGSSGGRPIQAHGDARGGRVGSG